MHSDEHPIFESASGVENQLQAAGIEQTPEATCTCTGPCNGQFTRGWDSLSPSSVFFSMMDLPPPVGHRMQTPGISRASDPFSSVLGQFGQLQAPVPVQPLRPPGIMVGSGDLSPP